jgi:hypothetical protein
MAERSPENKPVTKRTLRKRQIRAQNAIKEGRTPGVVGRPPVIDKEADEIITNMIVRDADEGNYHDLYWLKEMVFFSLFLNIFFQVSFIREARGGKQPDLVPPSPSTLYHWIQSHKTLQLKKVTNMDADRIRATNKEHIDPFFDLLEKLQADRKYRGELKVYLDCLFVFLCI